MEYNGMASFKTRKTVGKLLIFLLVFGIFIPLGFAIYLMTGDPAGLIFSVFGLLPVLYFLYRIMAPGSKYCVGTEGVHLKHGSSKRLIPPAEIRGGAVLSEDQAAHILNHYLKPAIESEKGLDLKGWYRANTAYSNFVRYCTVPIVQETTSRGSSLNITKFRNLTTGAFVLLKLHSGEEFLLSPEDGRSFFQELSSRVRLSDTTAESSWVPEDRETRKEMAGKRRKWYYLYSLGTFLLITTIVVVKFVIPAVAGDPSAPDSPQAEASLSGPVSGWDDENTFRLVVSLKTDSYIEDPEERKRELTLSMAKGYRLSLADQILGEYMKEKGLSPTEEEYEVLHDAVMEEVGGIEPEVLSSLFSEDYSALEAVIAVRGEGLRSRVRNRLEAPSD